VSEQRLLDQLLAALDRQGLQREPADRAALQRIAGWPKFRGRAPPQALYVASHGTDMEQHGSIGFLTTDLVRMETWQAAEGEVRILAFADHLMMSFVFGVDLATGAIYADAHEPALRVCDDIEEFIEIYLEDPVSLVTRGAPRLH